MTRARDADAVGEKERAEGKGRGRGAEERKRLLRSLRPLRILAPRALGAPESEFSQTKTPQGMTQGSRVEGRRVGGHDQSTNPPEVHLPPPRELAYLPTHAADGPG